GVPEEDHRVFRARLAANTARTLDEDEQVAINPLEFLETRFTGYIEDRRSSPRGDVLTQLATATFPDGATPELIDVARLATFLFAAGQETSARLLSAALLILAEHPDLQRRLRADRALIPAFVEETLRLESPVKADFRLVRTSTSLGGVDIPA